MDHQEQSTLPPTNQLASELEHVVQAATPFLRTLTETEAERRPQPDRWCAKEILGHLIDSACNNHPRFVRAQIELDLVFSGYSQDDWVETQSYITADWGELTRLWSAYNLHLVRIISLIPEEALARKRAKHNLHQIAWRTVPEDQPTTLAYFIRDYIGHLQHHLDRIRSVSSSD